MADALAADPTIELDVDPTPPEGRRLWERFSLAVAAFLLLLLMQSAFAIIARSFQTFQTPGLLAVVAFVAFGVLSGFAFALAVLLPQRVHFRHPRRALTLLVLPTFITALNLIAAFGGAALPEAVTLFAFQYLVGLQPVVSVLLGIAAASAFAEN